ncbi:MAG: anti-sigma factor [Ilumatobacter sp.]
MTDDRFDELLTLAALGELDEREMAELDSAVADDPERRAELDANLRIAAELQQVAPVSPPPSLKDSVMAAIDALDENSVTDRTLAPPAVGTRPVVETPVISLESERRRRRPWTAFAAAAAVAALFAGGLFVVARDNEPDRIEVVAAADDAVRRVLIDGELDGELEVVYSASLDAFVLLGTDIPVLADDETYQLWLVDAAGARSMGVFTPDDDGTVSERFDGSDPSEVTVGVTVEPAGGSSEPTLPIVASTSA